LGRKLLKTAPSVWDFVTLPEEDRATAIGNMHRKIGKDRACASGDILADRHRQTCSPQYFASAPAGEIISKIKRSIRVAEMIPKFNKFWSFG